MAMSANLRAVLETIALEKDRRGFPSEACLSFVRQAVMEEYGGTNLADRLLADIPDEWPSEIIAILLTMSRIHVRDFCQSAGRWWVEGNDLRKIEIAFRLCPDFALSQLDLMVVEEALTRIARCFPQFKCECERALHSRRNLG